MLLGNDRCGPNAFVETFYLLSYSRRGCLTNYCKICCPWFHLWHCRGNCDVPQHPPYHQPIAHPVQRLPPILITEVSAYDVELLLNKVAEGRARPSKQKPNNRARKLQGAKPIPVRANRVGEVVRKMFAFAVKWGWRDGNPATGFRRRMETPRERYLSQEEIACLATALDATEDDRAAGIIRLCMLTGARVGEVRQAWFEDFNLEHLSWTKPATTTKQRRVHRVSISDEAAAIVRQRRLAVVSGSPWLFPGDTPSQPVQEIRRFWARIQNEVAIPDVHIPDLRHTFASLLVSGGASLEMIGKLLGHSQMQTTQRYAHLMDSPLRAGVDAVANAFKPKPRLVHTTDPSSPPAAPRRGLGRVIASAS